MPGGLALAVLFVLQAAVLVGLRLAHPLPPRGLKARRRLNVVADQLDWPNRWAGRRERRDRIIAFG
jgi:hypothetical protein